MLIDHTNILAFLFLNFFYKQNTSDRRSDIHGSKCTIIALHSRCFVQMTNQHNGASCTFCYITKIAKQRSDLIGSVHIHIGSQIGLYRIHDHQPYIILPDCLFNSFICHGKLLFFLIDKTNSCHICSTFCKSWLDRISNSVLCGLVKDIEWFDWKRIWKFSPCCTVCTKCHCKPCFSFSRISLDQRYFSKWDKWIP